MPGSPRFINDDMAASKKNNPVCAMRAAFTSTMGTNGTARFNEMAFRACANSSDVNCIPNDAMRVKGYQLSPRD